MADYVVPPGCYGITMEDGTKYNANKRGRIEGVENPDHVRHIERNSAIGGDHVHRSTGSVNARVNGTKCTQCRFAGFGWQKVCPKCGSDMVKE